MDKTAWKSRIERAMTEAGTYKPYFDAVIDTLAGILDYRDRARDELEHSGTMLIEHTNKIGAKNIEQSPIVRLVNDLNKTALSYLRALGLTPAGLKRLDGQAFSAGRPALLETAIKELEE